MTPFIFEHVKTARQIGYLKVSALALAVSWVELSSTAMRGVGKRFCEIYK